MIHWLTIIWTANAVFILVMMYRMNVAGWWLVLWIVGCVLMYYTERLYA